jgi:hypothetical protein
MMTKRQTKMINTSTIRVMTYNKIDSLIKDIKKNTQMSDHFIKKVDINMKNSINKILNDYQLDKQY